MMRRLACCSLAPVGVALIAAQQGARNPWGYNFPPSLDAEVAAPAVHRVRYSDDHIMLMEVANPPGYPMQMHGHPFPSIFARSSGSTHLGGGGPSDQYMEPDGGRNGEHWHSAPPPKGTPSLECTAADPQAPHRPINRGLAPQHFYRIEFKRIADDDSGQTGLNHLRTPARTLYEDNAVRLIEVTERPGDHHPVRPLAYPAVLAFDSVASFDQIDRTLGPDAGRSLPPTGLAMPRCMTVSAGVSLTPRRSDVTAIHYYELEFKRVEGDGLKDHWREWYPFMNSMQ